MLNVRLVRLVSQRCARYKTTPVMTASSRAAIRVSQSLASLLAALSAAFSWVKTVFAAGSSTRCASSEATWRNEPPVSGKCIAYSRLRLRDVAGVDGQPAAERGERGTRRLAAVAGAQPGQVGGGRRDVALVALQLGQRRLGAGQVRRGDRRVRVGDRLVHLPGVEAERLVHADQRLGGRGVHGGDPAAERAPRE